MLIQFLYVMLQNDHYLNETCLERDIIRKRLNKTKGIKLDCSFDLISGVI